MTEFTKIDSLAKVALMTDNFWNTETFANASEPKCAVLRVFPSSRKCS